MQDHPHDGPGFGPQGFPDPDLPGALLDDDQHNVADPHHPGNDGTNPHKPEKQFDVVGERIVPLCFFQGAEDIEGAVVFRMDGMDLGEVLFQIFLEGNRLGYSLVKGTCRGQGKGHVIDPVAPVKNPLGRGKRDIHGLLFPFPLFFENTDNLERDPGYIHVFPYGRVQMAKNIFSDLVADHQGLRSVFYIGVIEEASLHHIGIFNELEVFVDPADPIDQGLVSIGHGNAIDENPGRIVFDPGRILGRPVAEILIAKLDTPAGVQAFVLFGGQSGPDPDRSGGILFKLMGDPVAHTLSETKQDHQDKDPGGNRKAGKEGA